MAGAVAGAGSGSLAALSASMSGRASPAEGGDRQRPAAAERLVGYQKPLPTFTDVDR